MPRNGSGTYSVPNSFTPATTIVSADVNANFDDIGDELSNSLAVDGQSAMSGPLKAANGSNAAPSVTFASDLVCRPSQRRSTGSKPRSIA